MLAALDRLEMRLEKLQKRSENRGKLIDERDEVLAALGQLEKRAATAEGLTRKLVKGMLTKAPTNELIRQLLSMVEERGARPLNERVPDLREDPKGGGDG